eukprot:TRINITY_DN50227_c0_g1_i2.p1 TRINITY_DN50227_c0_g1~~TRINITY_DN50227_c0_g1_i2.p1  ORF type:complete len:341 (-),score=29.21 TRINITY_DN50227_c0_g1_i2:347-1369(-)
MRGSQCTTSPGPGRRVGGGFGLSWACAEWPLRPWAETQVGDGDGRRSLSAALEARGLFDPPEEVPHACSLVDERAVRPRPETVIGVVSTGFPFFDRVMCPVHRDEHARRQHHYGMLPPAQAVEGVAIRQQLESQRGADAKKTHTTHPARQGNRPVSVPARQRRGSSERAPVLVPSVVSVAREDVLRGQSPQEDASPAEMAVPPRESRALSPWQRARKQPSQKRQLQRSQSEPPPHWLPDPMMVHTALTQSHKIRAPTKRKRRGSCCLVLDVGPETSPINLAPPQTASRCGSRRGSRSGNMSHPDEKVEGVPSHYMGLSGDLAARLTAAFASHQSHGKPTL